MIRRIAGFQGFQFINNPLGISKIVTPLFSPSMFQVNQLDQQTTGKVVDILINYETVVQVRGGALQPHKTALPLNPKPEISFLSSLLQPLKNSVAAHSWFRSQQLELHFCNIS